MGYDKFNAAIAGAVRNMGPGGICCAMIRFSKHGLLLVLLLNVLAGAAVVDPAEAGSTVRSGVAAMARQDYGAAARDLSPIAQRGNPEAQAYMGYLYATGRGVPQDYTQAAIWYRRAADQGHSGAQYELGLLYDKGQGVPVNVIEAEKWLILATAAAPKPAADDRTRMRDAVRTKMTLGELAQARMEALAWRPRLEQ